MSTVWEIVLVVLLACSDPVVLPVERGNGSFATLEACEVAKAEVLRMFGPPSPDSRLECRVRP